MTAVELFIHLFGASVVALLAAYVYQLFWGAHSSQQQRLGPGSWSLGQRRFRELTLRVDEVPAGTSAAKLESELQSIVATSPDLQGQLDGFVVRSLAPRDNTCARAILTVGTLLPEDQLLVRLQRASKEFPYRFDYTFYGVPSLCEVASGVACESTTKTGLITVPDRDLVPLRANNSGTVSSAADSRLNPSINQGGSSYNGNATVHGGSYHQGNVINIQETADRCLADLRVTDPRHDKERIQSTKGGLLADAYVWVLSNPDFCQWRDNEDQRLLWVKGDPGKGKTMLLCGIINELEKSPTEGRRLAYFFCQATDGRLNTATAVLRGLLFMLLSQDASLVLHMKEKYDTAGKELFEDKNAWQALSEIFTSIVRDAKLRGAYFIIDALDECKEGLERLLNLIKQASSSFGPKWLISSRNEPHIEKQMRSVTNRLSLELNTDSISAAVESFINVKVSHIAEDQCYRVNTQDEVCRYLSCNANGTFLWVALVCEELSKAYEWEAVQIAKSFPPGLSPLYQRMMEQISESRYAALCYRILTLVATAYRPLSFAESTVFIEEWQGMLSNMQPLYDMIRLCGSFLTVREETVYFVHQSAKDFLMKEQSTILFPEEQTAVHSQVFYKSIEAMSRTLKRDIYGLQDLGIPIKDVPQRVPNPDPLAAIRYACMHWIDHLIDASKAPDRDNSVRGDEAIDRFLRDKGLYWIESLSLLRGISEGMLGLEKLGRHLQDQSGAAGLQALVKDAYRLLQTFRPAIESRPLQAYASALVFSPRRSLIHGLFVHERPQWIECKTEVAEQWSACEATLEGHTSSVFSAAFSADGRRVVSASDDHTVKLWDATTGACEATLEGHTSSVFSAAFSADSRRVVSASHDQTVKLWDAATGACEATLEGHTSFVSSAAFSADGRRVVSASGDQTVKLWDAATGACLRTYRVGYTSTAAFDPTSTRIHTDAGDVAVDEAMPVDVDIHLPKLAPAPLKDFSLSADRAWIQQQSHPVLWLPPEYRPTDSAVFATKRGTNLVLGCSSGRVYLFHLSRSLLFLDSF